MNFIRDLLSTYQKTHCQLARKVCRKWFVNIVCVLFGLCLGYSTMTSISILFIFFDYYTHNRILY